MSEVKRYYFEGDELCEVTDDSESVLDWIQAPDFDAQRLRADTAEAELAQLKARYGFLRKVTPYRFKKMQDAASTDGGDVIYFHADKFDAQVDAALNPEAESQ